MKNTVITGIDARTLIIAFIFLIPMFFILNNDFDITIKVTLIAETLSISMLSFYYLYFDKTNISNSIVIVFFLLFFIIAPTIQLGKHPIFLINTLPYNEYNSFYINCLVLIFLISYLLSYVTFNRKTSPLLFNPSKQEFGRNFTFFVLLILAIVSAYIAIVEITELISTLNLNSNEEESTSIVLLRKKILYNIPIACFLYFTTLKFKKIRYKLFFTCLIILLILITKNPLLEKRNGLGPTYLMLLYIFLPKWFNNNSKILVTFIVIFIILFPLSSIFTNTTYSVWTSNTWQNLGNISLTDTIYEHFNSLHYDAWANVDSAIRYTADNGYQYGLQLIGVIFFFIPRAIWTNKPVATGHLVGDFLMNNFTMWFDNLSSPIISEGYVDFGIFGVILFGLLFALITHKISMVTRNPDKLKRYTAVYVAFSLMFVLRGSLMSSYAYICGSILTFVYLPKAINYFYTQILRICIILIQKHRSRLLEVNTSD